MAGIGAPAAAAAVSATAAAMSATAATATAAMALGERTTAAGQRQRSERDEYQCCPERSSIFHNLTKSINRRRWSSCGARHCRFKH
jgi:hypothetical protein